MKKRILIIILALMAAPLAVRAQADDHGRSVNEVLQEIRQDQEADSNRQIKCDDVTDEQWEALGDAVMSVMHPDPEQHELMDNMMGGEGSQSLRAMHILMGQRYLGCFNNNSAGGYGYGMMGGYGGGMGMMGGIMPMMGGYWGGNTYGSMMSPGGMMYGGWGFGLGWVFDLLFWTLAIIGFIALIRMLILGKRK